jgi:transcriptional regulator with XRE-family HTH domain
MTMAQGVACRLLGERLRRVRSARGLILKELEKLSGISATHISEIERGRTSPTLQVLERIAKALGMPTSFLVELPPAELLGVRSPQERRILEDETGRVRLERLTELWSAADLVVYRVRLDPGGVLMGETPPTEDLILVREGSVGLRMGEHWFHLRKGDAFEGCFRETLKVTNGNERGAELVWATRPSCHL